MKASFSGRSLRLALMMLIALAVVWLATAPVTTQTKATVTTTPQMANRQPLPQGDWRQLRDAVAVLTQKLVQINTEYEYQPPGSRQRGIYQHEEAARFVEKELRDIGLEVEVIRQNPDYPVVIGRLRGSAGKPVIGMGAQYNNVLIGDRSRWTVDPLGGVIRDGKVWGRGSANSKGSLASMLVAARLVKESGAKLKGDLVFVSSPGEGGAEFCMHWIIDNRPELIKTDYFIAGGGGGNITKAVAGHVWLKLIVRGTSEHPDVKARGVNAIHEMLKLMTAMIKVDDWLKWEPHGLFPNGKPRVEFGKIVGGDEVNMIPDYVEADVDIRTMPGLTPQYVKRQLDDLVERLKKDDPALNVDMKWIFGGYVPDEYWNRLTEDDPVIKTLFQMAQSYTGEKPEFRGAAAAGRPDLWRVSNRVLFIGLGRGANAHGYDEWVEIDGMAQTAKLYADLIIKYLKEEITPTS